MRKKEADLRCCKRKHKFCVCFGISLLLISRTIEKGLKMKSQVLLKEPRNIPLQTKIYLPRES